MTDYTFIHNYQITMPCMYFSGEESENIVNDDPANKSITINPTLYDNVRGDHERSMRVFLDAHLSKIRDESEEEPSEIMVPRGDASVSLGAKPIMSLLAYITNSLMMAEFREISGDEFKDSYLGPLDNAIKRSDVNFPLLERDYRYPAVRASHLYTECFNKSIIPSFSEIFYILCGTSNYFGESLMIRSHLDKKSVFKTNIAHVLHRGSFKDPQTPEICFAIGDYNQRNHGLALGLEDLRMTIKDLKQTLLETNRLEPLKSLPFFLDKEWSPRVFFALVLRKYLYQAFLCGTDRIFISDYQTFSGFFKYEIMNDKMTIDYYVIDDPETVANGITLKSAIAGFFYKDVEDALATKDRIAKCFGVTKEPTKQDPFENVLPRDESQSSGNFSGKGKKDPYKEDSDNDTYNGYACCRIMHNTPKRYPDLKLPPTVFTKLYYYSRQLWAEEGLTCFSIPDLHEYYDAFFNELEINEKLGKSQFASNFPKLFKSGYWNGLPDHPMHIFEYLGREIPMKEWDKHKVHKTIKLRLEELHLLGISHNDVRLANIHVSVSGKVSLIDFGLSDCTNNGEHKMNDLENLDYILGLNSSCDSSDTDNQVNQDSQKSDATLPYKAEKDYKKFLQSKF